MRQWLGAVILAGIVTGSSFAEGKGPEIQIVNDKLSINAEAVSLSRLLRLLDLATGMKSTVPPELANRNISVKFSGLDLNDGVRKMFQGQPLDYVVIVGQGIIVTSASQTIGASDSAPVYASPVLQNDQPFIQEFAQPPPIPNQQQPAMIQTPFGPMANPRAGQQVAPNAPLSTPGQQNSLFPQTGQQQAQPATIQTPFGPITNPPAQPIAPPFPGSATPGTSPFSSPSPFGTTNPQQQPQNLFGTQPFTNPSPFSSPGTQQRTP